MNKLLIISYYTFQYAHRRDTRLSHSVLPSVLPPAHAKEALELARMQEQTAQVKHHEEFKVCVCVCVHVGLCV